MAQFAIDEILTTGIQISGFVFDVSNNIGTNGYVLTSTSSGVMWQQDSNNADLAALSGQIAATGTLLNNRINSLSGYVNGTFISGSGIQNYVPRWNSARELITGSIYDLGTGVGIGTTNPAARLQISKIGDNGSNGFVDYGILTVSSGYATQATLGAEVIGDGYSNLNLGSNIGGVRTFWHISKRLSTASTPHSLEYFYYDGSTFNQRFTFTAAGNLGIGTVVPVSKLTVQGDINVNYNSTSTNYIYRAFATGHAAANRGAILRFGIDDGAFAGMSVENIASSNPSFNSQFIDFKTHEGGVSVDTRMRITPLGYVGIGTVSPISLLSIGGAGSTAASSGITFGGDSSANLYRSAAGALKIDGSLGIGINPVQKLQVEGVVGNPASVGTTQSGIFRISNTTDNAVLDFGIRGGGLGAWIQSTDETSLAANYPLLLNPNGASVGIGTTIPTYQLTVIGANQATANLTDAGAKGGSILVGSSVNAVDQGGAVLFATKNDANLYTPQFAIKSLFQNGMGSGIGDLAFSSRLLTGDSALTEVIRIKNDGRVGIGTSIPSTPLHVFSTTNTLATFTRDLATDASFTIGADNNGTVLGTLGVHAIQIYTNATERMRIASNGNVGIGTHVTPLKLNVSGSIYMAAGSGSAISWANDISSQFLKYDSVTDGMVLSSWSHTTFLTQQTERVRISSNGRVGIGFTIPTESLDVSGRIRGIGETFVLNAATLTDSQTSIALSRLGATTDQKYWEIINYNAAANGDFAIRTINDAYSIGIDGLRIVRGSSYNISSVLFPNGNIGVGTTNPASLINGNPIYFRPNPNAKILDIYSNTNEADINLISNNSGDGSGIGGIYFTRARGQTDAHLQVAAIKAIQGGTNGLLAGGRLYFYTKSNGGGTLETDPAMIIDTAGNIGIGTTVPSSKLTIYDHTNGATVNLVGRGTDDTAVINFRTSGDLSTYAYVAPDTNEFRLYHNDGFMSLYPGGSEKVRFTAAGNVGIGVTNPGVRLQVTNTGSITSSSTIRIVGATGNGGGSQIEFFKGTSQKFSIGTASSITGGLSDDLLITTLNPSSIILTAGLSGLAVFKTDGKVGIGMYNPISLLSIAGTGSTTAASGITFGLDTQANLYRSAEGTVKTDGNLIIGTDLYVADELGVGVPIANKRFNYGAQIEVASASIQLVLSRGATSTGQGAIGADASNVFAVWNVSGGLSKPFVISQQGNVGIGSETPTQKLEVSGTLKIKSAGTYSDPADNAAFLNYDTVGGIFTLSARSNAGNTYMAFRTSNGGTGSEKVRITNNGLVGISSNAPTDFLDFGGAGKNIVFGYAAYGEILNSAASIVGNNVKASPTANSQVRRFANATDQGNFIKLIYNKGVTFHTNITSALNTDISEDTNERMRIDLSGNVGIGTISPSGRLHIVETTPTGTRIQLGTTTENASMNAGLTNDLLILNAPYGTNSATVSNSGAKWGIKFIGTLEANQFNSTRKTSAIYAVSEDPTAGYNRGTSLAFYTNSWFDQEYTERMRIFHNGNIGIGTTQPSYKLQIVGSGTPTSPTVLQVAGLNDAGGDAKLIISQSPVASDLQLLVAGTDTRSDGFNANDQYILAGQQLNLFNRGNGSTYNTQIMIGRDGGYGNISFSTAPQNQTAVVRMYIASGGNVGIGTITPSKLLHVHGDSGEILRLSMPSNYTAGAGPQLSFWHRGDEELASIRGVFNETSQGNRANLLFGTRTSDLLGVETKMTILHNGNVGIGNTIPTGLLNVIRNSNTAQPIAFFKELYGTPPATNILLLERGNNLTAANQVSSNAGLRIRDHLANYSLSVEDHNSNVNFAISGTRVMLGSRGTNSLLNIGGASSTASASGITFGEDSVVNLYRLSASTLKTDAGFTAASLSSSSYVYAATYLQTAGGQLYAGAPYGTLTVYVGNTAQNAWEAGLYVGRGSYVGIGTTQPTGKLHVVSTVAGETVLRADGTNGTLFSVVDDLSDSLMSVNNSAGLPVLEVFADDRVVAGQYGSGDFVIRNNKVGIGATNPLNKLSVIGAASIGGTGYNVSAPTNGLIVEGNVGIGTTNPAGTYGKLVVAGGIRTLDDNNSKLELGRYSAGASNSYIKLGSNSNSLRITNNTDAADIFTILNEGSVGIGTTGPSTALHIVKNSDSNGLIRLQNLNATGYSNIQFHNNAGVFQASFGYINSSVGGGIGNKILLDSVGSDIVLRGANVGIGVTNPSQLLHISSTATAKLKITADTDNVDENDLGGIEISQDGGVTTSYFGHDNTNSLILGVNSTTAPNIYIGTRTDGTSFVSSSDAKVTILNGGNVGINTTAPTNTLQVVGQIAIRGDESADNAKIHIQASDNSNRYTVETDLDANTNNDLLIFRSNTVDNMVVLKGNGNVGIGTTNPAHKLEIFNTANSQTYVRVNNQNSGTGAYAGLDLQSYGGGWQVRVPASTVFQNPLLFSFNEVEKAVLTYDGKLGIGTTNPSTSLTISRAIDSAAYGSGTRAIDFKTYYPGYDVDTVKASIYAGVSSQGTLQTTKGYLAFLTSATAGTQNLTEKMRIEADGNIGIGSTNPACKLDVAGTIRTSSSEIYGFGANDNVSIRASSSVNVMGIYTSNVERLRLAANGYFGIGTDSPSTLLSVGGAGSTSPASGLTFGLDTSANLYRSAASTIKTDGNLVVAGTANLNGHLYGQKTVTLSTASWTTVLTINMLAHNSCYVKIGAFGDWTNHSAIAFVSELFIQNGNNAGYGEPGIIITAHDNTRGAAGDKVDIQIVDPAAAGTQNFLIQLKLISATSSTNSSLITYHVMGQQASVT